MYEWRPNWTRMGFQSVVRSFKISAQVVPNPPLQSSNARVGTKRCGNKPTMVKFTLSAKRKVKFREKDFEVSAAPRPPAISETAPAHRIP